MRLIDIAQGLASVPLALIGADRDLSMQIQDRLAVLGILDPPVDGKFGQVSQWALSQFLASTGLGAAKLLDQAVARRLLQSGDVFPLALGSDFAGRVVSAMLDMGYWLCRVPGAVNIVYVEGVDPDGKLNDNKPNRFNDVRLVIAFDAHGTPGVTGLWDGTTEPGRYYTELAPLDPQGAARIAFGQFKAWSVGTHGGSTPHEALVQTADITVHRDLDRDYKRDHDKRFTGMFGVNQHWGYDMSSNDIGRASAGCLVGRTKAGHRQFMALCRSDPRFQASQAYRFMTSVLPARALSSGSASPHA